MFNQIIVSVLAFLLGIFPSWGGLNYQYQSLTFNRNVIRSNIQTAIETRDIEALETMMCENIKQKVPNRSDEIGRLIDAIDGEISKFVWRGTSDYSKSSNGKRISQEGWAATITTSTGTYDLSVIWEIANDFAPKEVGIRNIGLTDLQSMVLLVGIAAPDGIRH